MVVKVLVANRGEIACRVLRTLRDMGIPSSAVFTDPDRDAPHVDLADDIVALGAPDQYLSIPAMLDAASRTGATAVHPGYGFLAQSPEFSRACVSAGLTFIGPAPETLTILGDKRGSRALAERAGVPVVPGAGEVDSPDAARDAAGRIGYPVLLKAAGGGGGKGMRIVRSPDEIPEAHASARREARASFADERMILEKYVHPARHVEVQILGDGRNAVALGDRDCSLQRRHQKVVEEAPAPGLPDAFRAALAAAATALARAASYRGAGTVEFLVGPDGSFHFLEVNARIQVEHPVTEMVTGTDIVRSQVELALGGALPVPPSPRGHAIEARLNAEDPYRGFLPQTGRILAAEWPVRPHVRVDAGIREGQEVGVHYDPLLAKIVAWGADREQARRRLAAALRETVLLGLTTNLSFLLQVVEGDVFRDAKAHTAYLESVSWSDPPPPAWAAAAASRLSSDASIPAASTGGGRRVPTPWTGARGFRVGG